MARSPNDTYDYDLAVIGGGAAGLGAARAGRRSGARVALISDGPPGGTFITARARLETSNLISVGNRHVSARRIVIAPPFPRSGVP